MKAISDLLRAPQLLCPGSLWNESLCVRGGLGSAAFRFVAKSSRCINSLPFLLSGSF